MNNIDKTKQFVESAQKQLEEKLLKHWNKAERRRQVRLG